MEFILQIEVARRWRRSPGCRRRRTLHRRRLRNCTGILPVPALSQSLLLLSQEGGRDPWTLGRGDLDALPIAVTMPGVVEPAAFAERCGQSDQSTLGYGQHGPDGGVQ